MVRQSNTYCIPFNPAIAVFSSIQRLPRPFNTSLPSFPFNPALTVIPSAQRFPHPFNPLLPAFLSLQGFLHFLQSSASRISFTPRLPPFSSVQRFTHFLQAEMSPEPDEVSGTSEHKGAQVVADEIGSGDGDGRLGGISEHLPYL